MPRDEVDGQSRALENVRLPHTAAGRTTAGDPLGGVVEQQGQLLQLRRIFDPDLRVCDMLGLSGERVAVEEDFASGPRTAKVVENGRVPVAYLDLGFGKRVVADQHQTVLVHAEGT